MEDLLLNKSYDEKDLERTSNVKNHLDDIYTLEDMGFNSIFIKKIYAFLRPQNIENAITLMTKENGKYLHDFRQGNKINVCFFCGEAKNFHQNEEADDDDDYREDEDNNFYFDISENNKINNNIKENYIEDINLTVRKDPEIKDDIDICEICQENYDKKKHKRTSNIPCFHSYCYTCWFLYIKEQIETSKVSKMKCLNYECQNNLSEKFIFQILDKNKKLIEKYKKYKLRLEILNDPNKKFCPHPGCEEYVERPKNDTKEVKCKKGHRFCYQCLREVHSGNCDVQLEKDFKIWKKGKIIKQCPKCKIWTEKNEGCNHMTCVECQYQWCWLCGEQYNVAHYTNGKCKGLQFFNPRSEEDIKIKLENNENNNIYNNININNNDHYVYRNRHILVDDDHPYVKPQRRKREYVSFYKAYVECNTCEYIFWIFMYFTTTVLQYGVLFHDTIFEIQDPKYAHPERPKKVRYNEKLDTIFVWTYMAVEFFCYFFLNVSIMIIASLPLIFFWPFFYGVRQYWWDNIFYNFACAHNILINYD